MPDDSVARIHQAQDDWINSLISNFQGELNGILGTAQARTTARLRDSLSITNGKIDRSARNTRILRTFDSIFLEELDRAGYGKLLDELVQQFPGQLRFFQDTLEAVSAGMRTPLPALKFSPRDLQVFSAQALNMKDGLESVMESVAAQAKNRILLSFGGLSYTDLVESLAGYLQRAMPDAVGLADTATSTYYRMIADRGYQIIEQDLPSQTIRYSYNGPLDKLNRPVCRKWESESRAGKRWTRAEIDALSNGQIPNVFISAGGFRCRHQWLIALD